MADSLSKFIAKIMGVEPELPKPAETLEFDVTEEDYDGREFVPREDSSDPAPTEIVIGAPVAVIPRPSRSWTSQGFEFNAGNNGQTIQVANRSLFRTRVTVKVTAPASASAIIRVAQSQSSAPGGAILGSFSLITNEIEIRCIGEVWIYIQDATNGAYVNVIQEFEDGGN